MLDAGLIAAAQHVEHYEMAGYGCVRTWARQLGEDRHAELLQETLDEEEQTDKLLTELAESEINVEAEEEEKGRTVTRSREAGEQARRLEDGGSSDEDEDEEADEDETGRE